MEQLLGRGYIIDGDKRIKKLIASGANWQIYNTNKNSHFLVASIKLFDIWVNEYSVPNSIFNLDLLDGYAVFDGKEDYIISSVKEGPYPENYQQIEGFSIAFDTTRRLFPNIDLSNALFIEEYSLLLPTSFDGKDDISCVYGKWLTGGVNVSIENTERVEVLTSWLPKNAIEKVVSLAGFKIEAKNAEQLKPTTDIGEKFELVGRPELEEFFNENIVDIIKNKEKYERMGIGFPGATILYGPPGCGKTFAIEKLTEFLNWPRFDIDSSSIASPYIHDTSKKTSEVFHTAIQAAPSIIVIDEMEAFLSDRNDGGHSGSHHVEEVAEFLRCIPEAISKGVLVFAMTNMIDSIDPAIRRRGRFDHIIEVKMPTSDEIEALLKKECSKLPLADNVNLKTIANELDGHPMSDVTFVLREAGRLAVKGNMDNINQDCFIQAINSLPKNKKENKIGF